MTAINSPVPRTLQQVFRRIAQGLDHVATGRPSPFTHELRTDVVIVRHPNRYVDKRGTKIWAEVMGQLAAVDSECRKIA